MHGKLPKKYLYAFTFIEVLVAISIMAILFTLGVANFRGMQRSKSLDAVKSQIVADLRQAQQFAQGVKRPDDCLGDLVSISLGKIVSSNSYEIYAYCSDSGKHNIETPINIPSGYTISFNPANPVQFLPVGQGVVETIVITVTSAGTGENVTITVGGGGEIR